MKQSVKNGVVEYDMQQVWQNEFFTWDAFEGKTIMVVGATGSLGSFLVRCLLYISIKANVQLRVVATYRDLEKAQSIFHKELNIYREELELVYLDVDKIARYEGNVDYIIHAACNTDSAYFISNPVETRNTIVEGTRHILDLARSKNIDGMVYLSSVEALGIISEPSLLKEDSIGKFDATNPRHSYNIGKKEAEHLCVEYAAQYHLPVRVARLAQVIGANANYDDWHVYAHFARCIAEKRDIVLHTNGESVRSTCYITDVMRAIILILLKGGDGEIYHVANENAAMRISDVAHLLTQKYPNSQLQWDIQEHTIYPETTYWNMSAAKLRALGWHADISLEEAYSRLISSFILQNLKPRKKTKRYSIWLNFLRRVFSIRNKGEKKIITILGFNIKLNRKKILTNLYNRLCKKQIANDKIVIVNQSGNRYGCNPKYIVEEILRRGKTWDIVWLVRGVKGARKSFPAGVRLAPFSNRKAFKELTNAHIWIDNFNKNEHVRYGLRKREGQFYINTWHGSFGIKKLDKHVKAFTMEANRDWLDRVQLQSGMVDFLITHSQFEDDILPDALWYTNCQTRRFGHPRNDVFFYPDDQKQLLKDKVYNALQLPPECKILLYAPTFRPSHIVDCYMFDTELILNALGDEWVLVTRMHHRTRAVSKKLFEYGPRIKDASSYPDIQELMVAAEMMLTDYSSCIFDFMLSGKPGFIFANDSAAYDTERGFYYPLSATPFPIARTSGELVANIQNFDSHLYQQKVDAFLRDKGSAEDGHAAARVVDMLEQMIEHSSPTN